MGTPSQLAARYDALKSLAEQGLDQAAIGLHFGVCRERARQLLHKAGLFDIWEQRRTDWRIRPDAVTPRLERWLQLGQRRHYKHLLAEAALRYESLGFQVSLRDGAKNDKYVGFQAFINGSALLRVAAPILDWNHYYRMNPRPGIYYYIVLPDGRRAALSPVDKMRPVYVKSLGKGHRPNGQPSNVPLLGLWESGMTNVNPIDVFLRLYYVGREEGHGVARVEERGKGT